MHAYGDMQVDMLVRPLSRHTQVSYLETCSFSWRAGQHARSLSEGARLELRPVHGSAASRCLLSVEGVCEEQDLVLMKVRGCLWKSGGGTAYQTSHR